MLWIVTLLACAAASAALTAQVPKDKPVKSHITHPSGTVLAKDDERRRKIYIDVSTTAQNASVHVNGRLAWWRYVLPVEPNPLDVQGLQQRGLALLVLHPITGRVEAEALTSGWMTLDTGHEMRQLVEDVRPGAVLVFFTVGEFGAGFQTNDDMLVFMEQMGAAHFAKRNDTDMYALIRVKQGKVIAESYVQNPADALVKEEMKSPLVVGVSVPVPAVADLVCPWPKNRRNVERAKFCFKYDGYGDLCSCSKDNILPITHEELENSNMTDVPIAVVASNRPRALYRMMSTLLRNRGIMPSNVIVFVDGEHAEVTELCAMLEVRCVSHTNDFTVPIMRIQANYRQMLANVWNYFPRADRLVVLEEDLDVAPDFISFFSQTSYLLDKDPTLWCISAWNDNGYDVTSSDPTLLYRIEYMPGLGWMMKRDVIQELVNKWPKTKETFDWDVWVRRKDVTKRRECVVPDVPRTYHFGIAGQHTSGTFHAMYYLEHAINTKPNVRLNNTDHLIKAKYEENVIRMLKEAEPLHTDDFILDGYNIKDIYCEVNITGSGKTYAVFFAMNNDLEDTGMFETMAKCFKIWDLDARGHHNGLWRFTFWDNHILMFGVPFTSYMNDVLKHFRYPVDVIGQTASDGTQNDLLML